MVKKTMVKKTSEQPNNTQSTMLESHIDLDSKVCKQLVELLNQQLADSADLYSQTKHAHWNVKGMQFMQLHELFDMLAEGVEDYIDIIAERITALGGVAHGTTRMTAAATSLPETWLGSTNEVDYLNHLVTLYSTKAKDVRASAETAETAGDKGTADLFNDYVRDLDKWRWFLESHLQG